MKLFIDVSLRDSGIAIFENKNLIYYATIKYKEKFDPANYLDIIRHYEYIKHQIKLIFNQFKIKEVVIEADTFGARKGGYKTKEILTLVRANLIHSIYSVSKTVKISFVRAFEWKTKVIGSSNIKKMDYKPLADKIIKEKFGQSIKNHNIVDAVLLGYYTQFEDLL